MDIYLEHKTVYKNYQQEKNPKYKEKYTEAHRAEITLYEAAEHYLKGVESRARHAERQTKNAQSRICFAQK